MGMLCRYLYLYFKYFAKLNKPVLIQQLILDEMVKVTGSQSAES